MDAAAATVDDETTADDPSVQNIPAENRRGPGSRSPTPQPDSSQVETSQVRLADRLAIRDDDAPGIADGDVVLEGRPESDAENNIAAVAASEERSSRRGKQTDKHPIETDSDREVADSRKRKKEEKRPVDKTEKPAKASKSTGRKRKPVPSPPDTDDNDDANGRPSSRHKPVSSSSIYNDFEGQPLNEIRRSFQTLMFARDGFPVKTLTIHRPINFQLALLAAKDAMDPRTYTDFKKKMEHAYADTTKE